MSNLIEQPDSFSNATSKKTQIRMELAKTKMLSDVALSTNASH